jgi:hypothetical protein
MHVGEQFDHHPVTIYDRLTDSNIIGYHRLCPNTIVDFEEIRDVQYSARRSGYGMVWG